MKTTPCSLHADQYTLMLSPTFLLRMRNIPYQKLLK